MKFINYFICFYFSCNYNLCFDLLKELGIGNPILSMKQCNQKYKKTLNKALNINLVSLSDFVIPTFEIFIPN